MAHLRKHAAILVLAAAIIVIISITASTYALRDNGTLYLQDLTGSRSALEGVTIKGEINDNYQRTSFSMDNGQVDNHSELFRQPKRIFSYPYSPGGSKQLDNTMYSVNDSSLFKISSTLLGDNYFIKYGGTALVNPTAHSTDPTSYKHSNPLEYGLAKIGNDVYFTPTLASESTLTSGVYKLKFIEWGDPANKENGSPKLFDYTLKSDGSDEVSQLEVLGLEAVGSKLVLISRVNNRLLIRAYDSNSGELLGETKLPDFYIADSSSDTPSAEVEAYNKRFETTIDQDQGLMNIKFTGTSTQLMLSVDFSKGVSVINQATVKRAEDELNSSNNYYYLKYKNGKLYVIRTFWESKTPSTDNSYQVSLPQHFYIYVYEKSDLIYKGELVTDINQDTVQLNSPLAIQYDNDKGYRQYMNLGIN